MPGRIPDRDIAAIRERVRIEDVVGEYVALKRGGADSMKGLCPFHDEKSPSFHVRPNHGLFHCFGCGEGGDVYAFIQKIEHVGFVEAVEQLADKVGYQINYEGGGTSVQRDRGTRARLVAANAAAHEFYMARLREPEAEAARAYLTERNFDAAAAAQFGCGYAPAGWDTLTKYLMRKGFEFKELEAAGLSREGRRGPIDRFHRRLLWPIRNLAGEVIGFGARKLFDDDTMPGKYVNTPETVLYKKSQVLFGLDHAKREIAKGHQAVVVEGYTDVMAMHLAGVKTAVAACGTAFGDDHLAILRRLLMDDNFWRGEIIFTFDGDAAGQAAALKAFLNDQKVAAQIYVATTPDGQDPCELRQHSGDAALRDVVAKRRLLFEFALDSEIEKRKDPRINDLTRDGQVEVLRWGVPLVAQIKDHGRRKRYATDLADRTGWLDVQTVYRRVEEEAKRLRTGGAAAGSARRPREHNGTSDAPVARPNPNDPTLLPQRQALAAGLQYPSIAGPSFDALETEAFTHPAYVTIRTLIAEAGGTSAGLVGAEWVGAVSDRTDDLTVRALISELASEPLPVKSADDIPRFVTGVLARAQEGFVGRQIAELKSKLHRVSSTEQSEAYLALFGDLVALEQYRKSLLEQAMGNSDDFAPH
ncbi:DNA primase [Nocardia cyriacigeorgica]|uniref:DNA primase n=1 Tax=Nocardia cyriacigeorgica TaxID=135487 RepID=UPI0018949A93|nr:DNA primase [Nocardia cyriacigeorgica]MBF6098062.1 DNA primase [Nocardia cyriacigeorgica]MBF6157883.1 DNA primase [Nocardia cyriacigeorgica]MBF6196855.1 DNA primase [Nocardia cyriacigeorgica]MBF6317877.1 DNA primase [Nocardia cyriacigeorgica]MBF6532657.1 DNA primase [Nocardia cyriacigeorgica]